MTYSIPPTDLEEFFPIAYPYAKEDYVYSCIDSEYGYGDKDGNGKGDINENEQNGYRDYNDVFSYTRKVMGDGYGNGWDYGYSGVGDGEGDGIDGNEFPRYLEFKRGLDELLKPIHRFRRI
jgi:hypothetical protein